MPCKPRIRASPGSTFACRLPVLVACSQLSYRAAPSCRQLSARTLLSCLPRWDGTTAVLLCSVSLVGSLICISIYITKRTCWNRPSHHPSCITHHASPITTTTITTTQRYLLSICHTYTSSTRYTPFLAAQGFRPPAPPSRDHLPYPSSWKLASPGMLRCLAWLR